MIHYSRRYALKRLTDSTWSYLPMPARGIARPLTPVGSTQTLLSGATVMDNIGGATRKTWRSWSLPFDHLDDDAAALVESWLTGAHGVSPYHFTEDNGATLHKVIVVSAPDSTTLAWSHQVVLSLQETK